MNQPQIYGLFDQRLSCDIPLPGLPRLSGNQADFRVHLAGDALDAAGWERVHEWRSAGGVVLTSCARRGDGMLLGFPGLGAFQIRPARREITAFAESGVAAETLAHLLIDQVMPRLLTHLGRRVVHASAVVSQASTVVAFLGNSGFGKSTLAAAFLRAGWALLADDGLLLELHDGRLRAIPSYSSVRLWPDSRASLFPAARGFTPVANYTSKEQWLDPCGSPRDAGRAQSLGTLFLLRDPRASPGLAAVTIRPAAGQHAVIALVESLFALDPTNHDLAARNFAWAGDVARCGVPLLELDYPRDYGRLGAVVESIARWLHSAGEDTAHAGEALQPPG